MKTRSFSSLFAVLFIVGCSAGPTEEPRAADKQDLSTATAPSAAPRCCPPSFDMYSCQEQDGGTGLACHNPALGCASTLACGQGCDPQVSGRCQCLTAADCHGPLPALCERCPDGRAECAHFDCVDGTCKIAICQ